MKTVATAGVLVFLFGVGSAIGAVPDNRDAAEQLLTVMNVERNLADIRDQVQAMIAAQIRDMKIPANMQDETVRFQKQLSDLVFDEFSFSKMKAAYADIYASTFSADELAGLIAFYKSPSGRAFVERMPVVTKRMLDVSQNGMRALQPRIQKLEEECRAQLKQAAAPH